MSSKVKFIFCALALGLNLAAQTAASLKSKITDAIQDPNRAPRAEFWRSLGKNAPKAILEIYRSDKNIHHRVRLLEAMGNFDAPAITAELKRETEDKSNSVVRNTAIRSLAQSQGMKEGAVLRTFLTHPDPQTRLQTAQALRRINDPTAQKAVDEFLAQEKTPWVAQGVPENPISKPSEP